ncbi:MAG: hypothetical protein ACHQRL_06020 [Gemmatimonadales bacterium]
MTDRVTVGLGRVLFLVAIAALGAECLVRGNVVPALEPASLSPSAQQLAGALARAPAPRLATEDLSLAR